MSAEPTPLVLVVGSDGSADSDAALSWAARVAGRHPESRIHLLEALALPPLPSAPWTVSVESILGRAEDDARARLERQAASFPDLRIVPHVRRWLPIDAIVELAAAEKADLVVVGRHGRTVRRLLVGSVSGGVARQAREPVVVVRGDETSPPATLLLALDGSEPSRRAAAAACRLFPGAARIAASARQHDDGLDAAAIAVELRAAGVPEAGTRIESVEGHPASALVALARDSGADLLVAGRTGAGPFDEFLFGGVAEKLLQLAPCPVLFAH